MNSSLPRILAVLMTLALGGVCMAETGARLLELHEGIARLESVFDTRVSDWRVHIGDLRGAEKPDFDDSQWDMADLGYSWPPDAVCWLRRWIEVPRKAGGLPVEGAELTIRFNMDNAGRVYVNGEFNQEIDWLGKGHAVLTEAAHPGDRFLVAVRAVGGGHIGFRPWRGALANAELETSATTDVLPRAKTLLARMRFALPLVETGAKELEWRHGLSRTMAAIDLQALEHGDKAGFLDSLTRAESVFQKQVIGVIQRTTEERLTPLASQVDALRELTRRGDERGVDLSYQRVTLTVAENFSRFARDDLASNHFEVVVRGRWNADWLAGAVPRAVAEAEAILRDPSRQLRVPRYKTGPVAIRRGAFWQDGRPLFFVGMGHFGDVRRDIPVFPDYGFNIAQITGVGPGAILTGPDTVNDKPIEELLAVLDRAAKANVAVDFLLELHSWPGWANEKYPEVAKPWYFPYFNYHLDHPRAQEILKDYFGALIPRIAGHPALLSYCLMNEPRDTDYSDFSRGKFHDWLREKHVTVARLNERYRANYASFEEISIPRDETEPGLWYDWCRFNQDRFTAVHRWMIDTIRALDPHTPVHSKVQGMLFDTYHTFLDGIDHEHWTAHSDISGNDNWTYRATSGEYAVAWIRQAMYLDFQRSVAPEHPAFNSENHPLDGNSPDWVGERHIRTAYWQAALHGQGATATWVWERTTGEDYVISTRPNCVDAMSKTALDLLRLADEVVALQQIKPEVALLVAPASIPFSEDYLDEMKRAYEGLYFLGSPVGFVTDRQVRNGGLAAFKAVFVPRAMRIEDDLILLFEDYVAGGGMLVVVGDSFAMDEYGKSRALPAFLPGSGKQAQAGRALVGKGMVIYRPGTLRVEEYRELGERLLTDLQVNRPVRVTDEKGRIAPGVMYWSARHNGGYLVSMVNYRSHAIPVRIIAPEKIQKMTNLFDGAAAPDFLELEPLEPLLLFLEAAR